MYIKYDCVRDSSLCLQWTYIDTAEVADRNVPENACIGITHKLYLLPFTFTHGDTGCIPNQTTWRPCNTKSASNKKTAPGSTLWYIYINILRAYSKLYHTEKSKPISKSCNPEKNYAERFWTRSLKSKTFNPVSLSCIKPRRFSSHSDIDRGLYFIIII